MTTDTLLQSRLQTIIALHFDPHEGTPFWLEKQQILGIQAVRQIRTIEDLYLLGPMEENALADRPIEDFIPAAMLSRRRDFILAETGGSTGRPKFAVHRQDEFHQGFVQPFITAAKRVNFPQMGNWLYIGPTGPHVIGKAARACAEALGSADPFTVDFDPRWAKKLPEGSFAARRYLNHIEEQALRILHTQNIAVIFSTPPVLESLGEKLDVERRHKIVGLHLGGMAITTEFREKLQKNFPQAVILSGFGNTLFGMAPEWAYNPTTGVDYYPHGCRLVFQVIELPQDNYMEQHKSGDSQRLRRQVDYGQRGQVVVHRLDEVQFIANMIERDTAVRMPVPAEAREEGFVLDGLRDPQPLRTTVLKPAIGLY